MGHSVLAHDLMSQHAFRSRRRHAAIDRKNRAMFDLQMSKLQLSCDFVKQREMLLEQVVALQTEIQDLKFNAVPSTPPAAITLTMCDAGTQTDFHQDEGSFSAEVLESLLEQCAERTAQATMDAVSDKLTAECELRCQQLSSKCELHLQQSQETLLRERDDLQNRLDEAEFELQELRAELHRHDDDAPSVSSEELEPASLYFGSTSSVAAGPHAERSEPSKPESDCGLCRNDLCLPVVSGTARVDWERVLGQHDLDELRQAQASGHWRCSICARDLVDMDGSYGHIYMRDATTAWEQKHMLSIFLDVPAAVRCVRCHYKTVACKYFRIGHCRRGSQCAFAHEACAQTAQQRARVCIDAGALESSWRHFVSAHDLRALSCASWEKNRAVRELLHDR